MVKKPKRTSKMLALLMAVVMTVGSVPTTTFAADSPSIGASSSSSTIIDDPVSGTTGSGWDNIDSGTGTPVTPPDDGEDGPANPPEGGDEGGEETPETPVTPPEGEGDGEDPENPVTPPEGGEDEEDPVTPPADGEGNTDGSVVPPEGEGTEGEIPLTPIQPSTPAINGTELPWAANFAAYAEATMGMPTLYIAGDAGGGKVEFTPYSWGVPGGDGTNMIWMGSKPNGDGYFFGDVYRSTYDGADSFCGEFNGKMPGGNYTRGEEGSNEQIKKILASYEKSSKSKADYIAAQTFIWAELLNTTVTHWGSDTKIA